MLCYSIILTFCYTFFPSGVTKNYGPGIYWLKNLLACGWVSHETNTSAAAGQRFRHFALSKQYNYQVMFPHIKIRQFQKHQTGMYMPMKLLDEIKLMKTS